MLIIKALIIAGIHVVRLNSGVICTSNAIDSVLILFHLNRRKVSAIPFCDGNSIYNNKTAVKTFFILTVFSNLMHSYP
jgi:hypothetical protein